MSKIQINYKSGNSMTFECEEFVIKRGVNGLSASWESAKPIPIFLGIGEIESVWEV